MKLVGGLVTLLGATGTLAMEWQEWKDKYGFEFVGNEDRVRYGHFLKIKEYIAGHNARYAAGQETYHVALNEFSAMPNEEFAQKYLMPSYDVTQKQLVTEYQCPTSYTSQKGHPDSWSWKGSQVTKVKNQGSCGSCWSFGAGAAIEGAMCAAGMYDCNSWNGVSEQQMVDCCSYNSNLNPYDNHGCSGGFQSNAMRCIIQNGGVDSWDNYAYTSGNNGREHTCAYNSRNSVGTISSCGRLGRANNEDLLVDMIYNQGVTTVAIDASGIGFQTYAGGVYSNSRCSSTQLNHAVTATGYGSTGGQAYYEIKNSWGTSWGAQGYMEMARNANNMCGVAAEGQWAIV